MISPTTSSMFKPPSVEGLSEVQYREERDEMTALFYFSNEEHAAAAEEQVTKVRTETIEAEERPLRGIRSRDVAEKEVCTQRECYERENVLAFSAFKGDVPSIDHLVTCIARAMPQMENSREVSITPRTSQVQLK